MVEEKKVLSGLYLYVATCKGGERKYVGTTSNPELREKDYASGEGSCYVIHYGFESFKLLKGPGITHEDEMAVTIQLMRESRSPPSASRQP